MSHDDSHEELAALLSLDERQLLLRLSEQVALGVGPLDPQRKLAIARAWMDAQQERLRDAVCGDPRVRALRDDASAGDLELAAAICDLVATIAGGLPTATVAMLLVRRGLDRLCG